MVGQTAMRSEIEAGASMGRNSYISYEGASRPNRTPWTTDIGQFVRMAGEQPKDRLKAARKAAGYDTPSEAARAFPRLINKNTLISNENGNRPISRKAAEKYGRLFNVDPGWILYGTSSVPQQTTDVDVP